MDKKKGSHRLDSSLRLARPKNMFRVPLQYGLSTEAGGRLRNEDAALALTFDPLLVGYSPAFGLFIAADGVGGKPEGAEASALAVRIISQAVMERVIWPYLRQEINDAFLPDIRQVVHDAILQADATIKQQIPDSSTTITCAVVYRDTAFIGHVGDTRAYLVSEDDLKQITSDHTMVGALAEAGHITAEEAASHPQRNIILQAVGHGGDLNIDLETQHLPQGSHLLLCSDGLWGVLTEEMIWEIVRESETPQMACQELVKAANDHGTTDNVTAVLVGIPFYPEAWGKIS